MPATTPTRTKNYSVNHRLKIALVKYVTVGRTTCNGTTGTGMKQ